MAFIVVELAGQKTFGGYLQIDGMKQIALYDGQIIPVENGTHYLSFSSLSTAQRNLNKFGASVGAWAGSASTIATAAYNERNSVDGEITVTLGANDIMFFTVVSDNAGHILSQPTYSVEEADKEKIEKANSLYHQQCQQEEEAKKEASSGALTEFLLCLFLGGLGVHKFYRKNYLMGIVYLFTGGLFGIGWIIDIIKLIKQLAAK